MAVPRKADSEQIAGFLTSLAGKDWVRRSEKRVWPLFLFHFTDIRNVVRILSTGYLYSRKYLEDHRLLEVSSGSVSVLAGTDSTVKDCVRLYFRPKTPTQYHAEGIRSSTYLSTSKFPDAHCPVPVFLLFDAVDILTRQDCQFSEIGLGAYGYRLLSTAEDLQRMPWKQIYGPGYADPARANAEVIVPQKLTLDVLRFVYCRSRAERETLIHLLPSDVLSRYQQSIVSTSRSDLFFRRHTFVETTSLFSHKIRVAFSPETESPGPFRLQCRVTTACPREPILYENEVFAVRRPFVYDFLLPNEIDAYDIMLRLDGHLAYASNYRQVEMPF